MKCNLLIGIHKPGVDCRYNGLDSQTRLLLEGIEICNREIIGNTTCTGCFDTNYQPHLNSLPATEKAFIERYEWEKV